MIIKPLPASSTTTVYNVSPGLRVGIEVTNNPYQLPLEALFQMALRKNPKRRFLFVSKLLGKHLPVHPEIPGLGGRALALCYIQSLTSKYDDDELRAVLEVMGGHTKKGHGSIYAVNNSIALPEKTLFVGFAETATALGYSVFSSFTENAHYLHTTRAQLKNREVLIRFEEEHSHATAHRLYGLRDLNLLKGSETLVLVDDEITTGKTALNIIEAIQAQFPRKRYALLSLLDWRSPQDVAAFKALEERLQIEITTVSLLAGNITVEDEGYEEAFYEQYEQANKRLLMQSVQPKLDKTVTTLHLQHVFSEGVDEVSISDDGTVSSVPFLQNTGRFGLSSSSVEKNWQVAQAAVDYILSEMAHTAWGSNCLCLGTGEFIQLPAMMASALNEKMPQCQVAFHSTTRSPICPSDVPGYGARSAYAFASPEDLTVMNYVYNITPRHYDTLLVFMERACSKEHLSEMMQAIEAMEIANVGLVFCQS